MSVVIDLSTSDLYRIKETWFNFGREEAFRLAEAYGRVYKESPELLMEKARKVKL
jgi:hypothetical protein